MEREKSGGEIGESFLGQMPGGAFVYRSDAGHELLFANQNMVQLFECDDYEDFLSFVGNSFDGIVNETKMSLVQKEMELQIAETKNSSGYVFYNIRTKKGNVRRVVNHWTFVQSEEQGGVFCAYLFLHQPDNVGSDFDPVTGLYGKTKFRKYVSGINKKFYKEQSKEYAIVYVNLVKFKLLNIEKGATEGDICLKMMADILRSVFEDSYVSRISGDHFAVFTKCEGVYQKTEEVGRIFAENYGNPFGVTGKFGIYPFLLSRDFDVESALSFAKVACDYVKHDFLNNIVIYSESIADEMMTTEYVVEKIDEAIENDWIKVYYQPVVRALTGSLCGMESLVRWDDPVVGFLSPDQFVSTLERGCCIHKLDSYVVEKVCECIRERMLHKEPVVPVSVNFSRQDFVMCDMLHVVESAVNKYEIPKDFIHIEITESMIASDEELMRSVIENFREAGYEIWMDDFGSGYSSLTLLKDYHFDTLKMDMRFLTPFTEKAKSIMRAVVCMAKEIGMKTLAEGVETKEQLEFLQEIGCGMIQGYYYGKPEPVQAVFWHMKEKEIPVEVRQWRLFYEAADPYVKYTDTPLELVEDDGREFKTLFMNRSYQKQIFDYPMGLEEMDRRIYHTKSPLLKKYREMAERLKITRKAESFYYTDNGNYLCFYGQCIAECAGHYLITGSLINITYDQRENEKERLDARLRDLTLLFEDILVISLSDRMISPLLRKYEQVEPGEGEALDLKEAMDVMVKEKVFPSERIRCQEFLDPYSLRDRVDRSGRGYISEVLRVREADGGYQPKEITIMMIPGTSGDEYLYCVKPHMKR